jgi:hypothetical protein
MALVFRTHTSILNPNLIYLPSTSLLSFYHFSFFASHLTPLQMFCHSKPRGIFLNPQSNCDNHLSHKKFLIQFTRFCIVWHLLVSFISSLCSNRVLTCLMVFECIFLFLHYFFISSLSILLKQFQFILHIWIRHHFLQKTIATQ